MSPIRALCLRYSTAPVIYDKHFGRLQQCFPTMRDKQLVPPLIRPDTSVRRQTRLWCLRLAFFALLVWLFTTDFPWVTFGRDDASIESDKAEDLFLYVYMLSIT